MSWANKATHDYNVSLGNVLRVELVRLLRYIAASDLILSVREMICY